MELPMSPAKKILIVDDEEDITILTEKFLQLENYDTLTCSNGYDALDILKENHQDIDLVLLDIMLPGMSGYEILTQIKSSYPEILVVLFTVKNFYEDFQKAKELGADGYLVKAISGNEIINYIKDILEKKKKKENN
ncbi:MAG: response regulator [Candidatus Lokiarchaeota archaeon]|nr:response regulator [Candidatus Lokiarchaeota archaeon]